MVHLLRSKPRMPIHRIEIRPNLGIAQHDSHLNNPICCHDARLLSPWQTHCRSGFQIPWTLDVQSVAQKGLEYILLENLLWAGVVPRSGFFDLVYAGFG